MTRAIAGVIAVGFLLFAVTASGLYAAGRPGDFAYYTLALSWSPTYCETEGRGRKGLQCAGPRPFAFVLHGLWPQHAKGWPESCDIGAKPWVPRKVIDAMLDIMPARGLVIHQYKKHGTCSGLGAKAYFDLSRRLFEQIQIPARYLGPRQAFAGEPKGNRIGLHQRPIPRSGPT